MGIPENLKRLRKREDLSQGELAAKAGVAQQLISQLETGKNSSTKMLPQIARALNSTAAEIDPNYAVSAAFEKRAELDAIFAQLEPEWQEHLLEDARRLEGRVRGLRGRPAPKAATGE